MLPPRFASLVSLVLVFWCASCTTGEGQGNVTSEDLYIRDCYRGPFSLNPTFFGANPYGGDTLSIRIQRGDDLVGVSDGLSLTVEGVSEIREGSIGAPIGIGLPAGVSPPGMPVTTPSVPAPVSMALYLHASCNAQNGALYSLCGTIVFDSLFSGDANEEDSEARFTDATFTAIFGDPRDALLATSEETDEAPEVEGCDASVLSSYDASLLSVVEGDFSFFFQRGPPAQPFP